MVGDAPDWICVNRLLYFLILGHAPGKFPLSVLLLEAVFRCGHAGCHLMLVHLVEQGCCLLAIFGFAPFLSREVGGLEWRFWEGLSGETRFCGRGL